MSNLSYELTRTLDAIWLKQNRDGEKVSFMERCKELLRVDRIRARVFQHISEGLQEWPGWREAAVRYRNSLLEYHAILEYLVRRLFKMLHGKDHVVMFEWFVRGFWPKATVTNVLIEGIKKSNKGSKERRIYQAVLHASFSLQELNRIMKQHEDIMDGYVAPAVGSEKAGYSSNDGERTAVDASGAAREQGMGQLGLNVVNCENDGSTAATHVHTGTARNGYLVEVNDASNGRSSSSSVSEPEPEENGGMDIESELGGDIAKDLFGTAEVRNMEREDVLEISSGTNGREEANNAGVEAVEPPLEGDGHGDLESGCVGRDETMENERGGDGNDSSDDGGETSVAGEGYGLSQVSTQASTGEAGVGTDNNASQNGSTESAECEKIPTNVISRLEHWRGRRDMRTILAEGALHEASKHRKRFDEDSLTETVRFILSSNNIHMLSWGVRRVLIGGERIQFPTLVRKTAMETLWRIYARKSMKLPRNVRKVGRTVFCGIVSKLTRGDVKQRACVDYKLHALVYENTERLKRIIDDNVREYDERKKLKRQMKGVCEYLKYSYITHIGETSNDPYHDVKFGLKHGKLPSTTRVSTCIDCLTPFKFLKEVRTAIVDVTPQIDKILTDSSKKYELFMGHIVRKKVQDEQIDGRFEWIRRGGVNERVVVYIDFKMKVEPQRFRESTLQYYGKAGMSLHGAAVFYLPDKSSDGQYLEKMKKYSEEYARKAARNEDAKQRYEAQKEMEEQRLSMFFVDHVIENDKKQDVVMVSGIVDALLARIKRQVPEAAEICFISDNARNYNNDLLPVMLPMICKSHNVQLHSILHPDACCGKSCVDGHFAVAWRHVKRYIEDTESDVVTPEDLMDVLVYDGGVKNTAVDFIKVHRDNKNVEEYVTALEAGLIARLGSPEEVLYEQREDGKLSVTCFPYSKCYYRRYVMDQQECFWDDDYVYSNEIDKEELSEDELFYVNIHGERKERDVPGPKSKTVKKNRREKYRKLKALREAADGASQLQKDVSGRTDELMESRESCNCEQRHEALVDGSETEGRREEVVCNVRRGGSNDVSIGDVTGSDGNDIVPERSGNEEHDIDSPSCNVDGVVNMTDEVRGRRRRAGKTPYHDMDPIMVCSATGVEVKFMSTIHHWSRDAYISTKSAFQDALVEAGEEEEREVEVPRNGDGRTERVEIGNLGSDTNSNGSGDVTELRNTAICDDNRGDDVRQDDCDISEAIDDAMTDVVVHTPPKLTGSGTLLKELKRSDTFQCMKCGTSHRQKKWFDCHVEKCGREDVNGRSVDNAVRIAHALIYIDKSVETYTRHDRNPLTKDIVINAEQDYRVVKRGWAKEPKKGTSLGECSMEEFRDQVKEWFDIGSATPGQKMSAARMLHLLVAKYQMRYDLPTEKQINSLITKFSGEEKKSRRDAAQARVDETEATAGVSVEAGNDGNGNRRAASRSGDVEGREIGNGGAVEGPYEDVNSRDNAEGSWEGGNAEVQHEDGRNGNGSGAEVNGSVSIEAVRSGATVGAGIVKAVTGKRKRTSYQMPKKYADFITDAVVNNKKLKRCDTRNAMIVAMRLSGKALPDDFPSDNRVKKRVTYVRGIHKKEADKSK